MPKYHFGGYPLSLSPRGSLSLQQTLFSLPRQGRRTLVWFALICCIGVLLAGCGPERSGATSEEDLTAETIRIAQEYVADHDLNRARVQLQELEAANATQWLVYLTETSVTNPVDPAVTNALVELTIDLGIQSAPVLAYAEEVGIIEKPQPVIADVGTAQQEAPAVAAAADQALATSADETATDADTPDTESTSDSGNEENTAEEDAAGSVQSEEATTPESSAENAASAPEETTDETEAVALIPTETPVSNPTVTASTSMNVRGGPGTVYPVVGVLDAGAQAEITAKNPDQDWWQVLLPGGQTGWVYGPLVQTAGDTSAIAVAADIPEPPPTPTPAPVAEAPPAEAAPEPAAEEPAAEEPAPEQPAPSGPHFTLIEKRLWDVYENGGQLSGPTVICGEKRQLVVQVVDANGSRINGVAVQEQYGAKEIQVTGAQGKGDGVAEFILGRGQDIRVVRDSDGRDATSDLASGMSTEPGNIPYEVLIGGRYCTDDASCKSFVDAPGCWGHYSWTVTFQRNY